MERRYSMSKFALSAVFLSPLLAAQTTTQLTKSSGGGERQPVLSADGTTVAYVAQHQGTREVFTVSSTGGTATRLTTAASVRVGWGTLDAWPSISVSVDGRYVSYWNAKGIHIVDTVLKTDTVVDAAYQHPYPQLTEDGSYVIFQKPVAGQYEVFRVARSGGMAQQMTQGSGFGYRLPATRSGKRIVFQKPVQGVQEVFTLDVTTRAQKQISKNSAAGNRYAQLSHDDARVVYEVSTNLCREVHAHELTNSTTRAITKAAAMGDRNPVATGDGEVFYQVRGQGLELHRVEADGSKQSLIVQGLDGGLRRIVSDRHGRVVVYQAQDGAGTMEVYAARFCSQGEITTYGSAGTPSVGRIVHANSWYRCNLRYGLETSLGSNVGVFLLGFAALNTPYPMAPGNTIYAQPTIVLPQIGKNGRYESEIPVPNGLNAPVFTQWLVLDRSANAAGVVLSQGVRTAF